MREETIGTTVNFSLEPKNLPPLTAAQKARSTKLKAMKDQDINTSDIPAQTVVDWVRSSTSKPMMGVQNKQLISLRLDPEVLDFFKAQGARYQTRISAVLQEYVRAHRE